MKILYTLLSDIATDNKKNLLIILGLFLSPIILQAAKLPPKWIFDTTINKVDFYHSIVECGGKKVVFLKFNNHNSTAVKVTWNEVFTTQFQNKKKLEGPFREKQVTLSAGETSVTDCDNIRRHELLARPNQLTPVYDAAIVKFSFTDIKVTK